MSVESVNAASGEAESAPASAPAPAPAANKERLCVSTLSLASYDKRLNPDAPVFVPRSRTLALSTLAQKFMQDGEDISCGRAYDSIWREASATPTPPLSNMPNAMNALMRPLPLPLSTPLPPPLSIMPTLYDSTMNLYRPIARPRLQQLNFRLRRTQSQQVTSSPLNIDAPEYVPHSRSANSNVSDSTGTLVTMELPKIETATFTLLEAADDDEIVSAEAVEAELQQQPQLQQQEQDQEQEQQLPVASAKCLAKAALSFKPDRKHYDADSSDNERRNECCCSIM